MKIIHYLEEIDSINVIENVQSWREAIYLCMSPLLHQGYIHETYITTVQDQGEEMDFYYLLTEGLAMPHARADKEVIKTGVSLLVVNQGISFGNHEFNPIYCLMGLATLNDDSHITLMVEIAELFNNNPDLIDQLRLCASKDEIFALLNTKK